MTLTPPQTLAGYAAAQTGAAFYRLPDPGCLRISGRDERDFIQRQTTNDIRALTPDRALRTVLTSPTARVLDVWRLFQEPEGIGAITLAGRGAATARYLQGRIFFMDKVAVTEVSADSAQFELFGPGAAELLARSGVQAPAPEAVITASMGDSALRVIGMEDSWLLIVPAGQGGALAARLVESGAAALEPEAYEVLRVERGIPGPAHELTEDYTPLETNLDAAISDAKGCYTGQEIIARQVTYDKITRRMVGLRLDALAASGDAVQVEGRSAGEITSAVHSPRCGAIALAILKRPHHAPGTVVTVGAAGTPGGVVALPFED